MAKQIEFRVVNDTNIVQAFKTRERNTPEATAKAVKFLADWNRKPYTHVDACINGRWQFYMEN